MRVSCFLPSDMNNLCSKPFVLNEQSFQCQNLPQVATAISTVTGEIAPLRELRVQVGGIRVRKHAGRNVDVE